MRHLAAPLLNQAVSALSNHLPVTDVAQVEFSCEENLVRGEQAAERRRGGFGPSSGSQTYYAQAAPRAAPGDGQATERKPSGCRCRRAGPVRRDAAGPDRPATGRARITASC